ncbi:MAG: SurA N-terminal domain-containing protein [Smithellaceae bacterium]|nr:SurA N-terminal domain-containing protein [Smithellaceae bacterium]
MEEEKCPYCEHEVGIDDEFCPECKGSLKDIGKGAEIQPQAAQERPAGKRTWLVIGIALLGLAGLISAGYFTWKSFAQKDVAARVNEEKIYWREVDQKLESFQKMFGQGEKPDMKSPEGKKMLDDLRNRILDSLIQEKILMAEVTRGNWSVTAEEVDQRISNLKNDRKLSDKDLDGLLQNHGLTMEDFKQRTQREMLIEKAMENGVKETGLTREAWLEKVFSLANVEVFPPQ